MPFTQVTPAVEGVRAKHQSASTCLPVVLFGRSRQRLTGKTPVVCLVARSDNKSRLHVTGNRNPAARTADTIRYICRQHTADAVPTPAVGRAVRHPSTLKRALHDKAYAAGLSAVTLWSRGVAHVFDQVLAYSCSTG